MSETMRKMSTLKFPKVPERYEIVDAQARKSIEGLEKTTSTHGKDIDTLKKTVSTQGTSISTLTSKSTELQNDVSELQDHFSSDMKEVSGGIIQIESMAGNVLKPVTVLEPKQAGSGDPYPAGGGKNLLPFGDGNWTITNTVEFSSPYIAIPKKLPANQPLVASVLFTDGTMHTEGGAVITLRDASYNIIKAPGFTKGETFTLTEDEAERVVIYGVYFNGTGATLNSGKTIAGVQLEVGTMQTTFAPYSNIRPITGWDALSFTRCGKNILAPVRNWSDTRTHKGVTYTQNADGSITVKGTATELSYAQLNVRGFNFVKGVSYVFKGAGEGTRIAIGYFTGDGEEYDVRAYSDPGEVQKVSDISGQARIYLNVIAGTTVDTVVYPQCEIDEVSATYEPYNGSTHTVQIGQTVYGGRVDWSTGKLMAEWALMDGGSRNWSVYEDSGVTVFLTNGDSAKIYGAFNIISSHYKTSKNALVSQMGDMEIKGSNSSNAIFVRDTRYTDPAAFKTAMNGVQICYMLEKPIEIQLTPTQILALQGTNTFYGDGTISLSTKGDIVEVVDRVTAVEQTLFDTKEYKYNGSLVQFDAPLEGSPIEVVTVIEPKQAGSGDPYPAGGGRNLLNWSNISNRNRAEGVSLDDGKTIKVTAGDVSEDGLSYIRYICVNNPSPGEVFTLSVKSITPSAKNKSQLRFIFAVDGTSVISNKLDNPGTNTITIPEYTGEGSLRVNLYANTGNDGAVSSGDYTIFEEVQLEVGATATAWQSYSNIRPIIGYDALGLNHAGKNLLPLPHKDGNSKVDNGVTYTVNNDGSVNAQGVPTAYSSFALYDGGVFSDDVIMTIGNDVSGMVVNVQLYSSDGELVFNKRPAVPSDQILIDYTSYPNAARTVIIAVRQNNNTEVSGVMRPMLRLASDPDATYEPYQGKLHTVQIGQTVYGGRIDWNTGKLLVTHTGMDMGDMDWTYASNSDYTCFNVNTTALNVKPAKNVSSIADIRCSIFKPASWVNVYNRVNNTICVMDSGSVLIRVYTDAYTNAADFKAAMAGQMVVWELATPFEIQLTPQDLTTLRGMNTIYSDAGETSISVRKDILGLTAHLSKRISECDCDEVYELIERITVGESAIISRTVEPNGTPYKFKSMLVRVNNNGVSINTSLYAKYGDTFIGAGYHSSTDTKNLFAIEVRQDRGWWVSDNYLANSSSVQYAGTSRAHESYMFKHSVRDYPYIDRFTTSAEIPAGTIIEIWGVRV